MTGLVDQHGRPLRRVPPQGEVARPTLTGVRQIIGGHPANHLKPERLAAMLREAEDGDATAYFELAEDMEERDLHYLGVLATRKRAVAQLPIDVEAASDDPLDVRAADLVRAWLDRDELESELFDILDAIGKGLSVTEIIWSTSGGRWLPERLEWRDPRWFELSREDGRTLLLRGDDGAQPLEAHRFVIHRHQAKSGLPIRGGLARAVAWSWMFKHFAMKDWIVFCEVYGQPLRLGKYGPGAKEEDKEILWEAVSQIASDCAAILPEEMKVEFVFASGGSTNTSLWKDLCDFLDQQVSKAVLGQTTTTDAISGGHAVAQEHRQVQEDIERADAKLLAASLNRQLVRPIVEYNIGPRPAYPRLRIGREEAVDLAAMSTSLQQLVPLGLKVQMSEVRDKLGFAEPEEGAEVLTAPAPPTIGPFGPPTPVSALHAAAAQPGGPERMIERLGEATAPALSAMLGRIERAVAEAGDHAELRRRLRDLKLDGSPIADIVTEAMLAAHLAGRYEVVEDG